MRCDSLQREIMEGRMASESLRGRRTPRHKLMDWMMENGHGKLKEKAQQQEESNQRTFRPAKT